jgi:alpha-glucuronidase
MAYLPVGYAAEPIKIGLFVVVDHLDKNNRIWVKVARQAEGVNMNQLPDPGRFLGPSAADYEPGDEVFVAAVIIEESKPGHITPDRE